MQAISEPPPPYTAGVSHEFQTLANVELPSYNEAVTTPDGSNVASATISRYDTNYALNSVPFHLSPMWRIAIDIDQVAIPALGRMNMRQYWYDFSFERTFLRDSEWAVYDPEVEEYDACPGFSGAVGGANANGLIVDLPPTSALCANAQTEELDDIESVDLIVFV